MAEKIYVSGKIAGLERQAAFDKFQDAEFRLAGHGYDVVNPMKIDRKGAAPSTWEEFMVGDIEELLKCNAIYMLRNWGQSRGARVEYAIARELGINIIFEE